MTVQDTGALVESCTDQLHQNVLSIGGSVLATVSRPYL